MKRNFVMAILLAILSLGLVAAGCSAGLQANGTPEQITSGNILFSQQNTGIWVNGEGKVSVVPDIAVLSVGVEAQAATVDEAQRQATEAMNAVIDELDRHGVAEKDIKTSRFSIYPVRRWENNKEILLGYRVTNMVTAKIREVEEAGIVIDAVARAGGDYTRIDSINFTIDDPTAYYGEVREKAIADAKAKAKQLADLADVGLGKPIYISEGGVSAPVTRVYYEGAAAAPATAPTPISPGEMEIRLNVQVVYSIN